MGLAPKVLKFSPFRGLKVSYKFLKFGKNIQISLGFWTRALSVSYFSALGGLVFCNKETCSWIKILGRKLRNFGKRVRHFSSISLLVEILNTAPCKNIPPSFRFFSFSIKSSINASSSSCFPNFLTGSLGCFTWKLCLSSPVYTKRFPDTETYFRAMEGEAYRIPVLLHMCFVDQKQHRSKFWRSNPMLSIRIFGLFGRLKLIPTFLPIKFTLTISATDAFISSDNM